MQYFATNPNVNQTLDIDEGFHYFGDDSTNVVKFQNVFKLPFAGGRSAYDAFPDSQDNLGFYWSSSPFGSDYPGYAAILYLSSFEVNPYYDIYSRARGFSVRCFKDSPDAPETLTITFDENG